MDSTTVFKRCGQRYVYNTATKNVSDARNNEAFPMTRGNGVSAIQARATAGRSMPATVDAANEEFEKRRTRCPCHKFATSDAGERFSGLGG